MTAYTKLEIKFAHGYHDAHNDMKKDFDRRKLKGSELFCLPFGNAERDYYRAGYVFAWEQPGISDVDWALQRWAGNFPPPYETIKATV